MIFDVDGQKLYMFESGKKEADVYDMGTFAADMAKSVDTANMKVSMKPNGQTKDISGKTATGYDLEITVPATMGGNKDMTMVMTLSGPTWIVKDAPGTKDYINFYKNAAEKGWIFSNPQRPRPRPGRPRRWPRCTTGSPKPAASRTKPTCRSRWAVARRRRWWPARRLVRQDRQHLHLHEGRVGGGRVRWPTICSLRLPAIS